MMRISLNTMETSERAAQIFDASMLVSEYMLDPDREDNPRQLSASDLYRMTSAVDMNDADIETIDREPETTRAAYVQMLDSYAIYHLPPPMAASTDTFPARDCEGCRLRFESSRAESDQIYIIIELHDRHADLPHVLIVSDADNYCRHISLPAPRNGIIQLISQRNSPLMEMLSDPRTKVILR